MKHTKLILILVFIMALGLHSVKAQHSVNATGGNVSSEKGSVSFSVGQMVYSAYSNNYCKISEGVQQPFEIFVITFIKEIDGLDLQLSAFPNPVDDQLQLLVTGKNCLLLYDLYYQLFDIHGKSMKKFRITDDISLIDMSGRKPGIYFLQVTASGGRTGLFKIIKR